LGETFNHRGETADVAKGADQVRAGRRAGQFHHRRLLDASAQTDQCVPCPNPRYACRRCSRTWRRWRSRRGWNQTGQSPARHHQPSEGSDLPQKDTATPTDRAGYWRDVFQVAPPSVVRKMRSLRWWPGDSMKHDERARILTVNPSRHSPGGRLVSVTGVMLVHYRLWG